MFSDIEDLTNPMNGDKPVKICRDGQEVTEEIGKKLMSMIEAAGKPAAEAIANEEFPAA